MVNLRILALFGFVKTLDAPLMPFDAKGSGSVV
jgi:hypothetical protein